MARAGTVADNVGWLVWGSCMRLPYAIDNRSDETQMSRVLADLPGQHQGREVDVATALLETRDFRR